MENFMQQAQNVIAYLIQLLQTFWQWQYALWVTIAVIVVVVILIAVAASAHRRRKMASQKKAQPVAPVVQKRPPVSQNIPARDLNPVLPLDATDERLAYTIHPIDDTPRLMRYASLSKKLQNQQGVVSESMEAECVAVGADFLPELLRIYPQLDPGVAQDMQEIVREQGWMPQYVQALDQEGHNKETMWRLWQIFPDVEALPQLVELLSHKDEHIRLDGVWLLGQIHDKRALPFLVAALLQPKKYLTARVGEVFEAFDGEAADLLASLLPRVQLEHKLIILDVLSQFEGGYALVPVLDCLHDASAQLRAAAATTLGESNYFEAQEAVLEATYDQEAPVRAAAAKALGRMRCQTAGERLRQLLVDEDFLVRANAKEALDWLELG